MRQVVSVRGGDRGELRKTVVGEGKGRGEVISEVSLSAVPLSKHT